MPNRVSEKAAMERLNSELAVVLDYFIFFPPIKTSFASGSVLSRWLKYRSRVLWSKPFNSVLQKISSLAAISLDSAKLYFL